MRSLYILFFLLICLATAVFAQQQTIHLAASEVTLNKILLELREKYGFQLAYNEDLLAGFKVSVHADFPTREEALNYLLGGLPLSWQKSGDVFLIVPLVAEKIPKVKPAIARIEGQVVESGTSEPLPFSSVWVNNRPVLSDQNGNFSYLASADTTLSLRISHLGYFIYDTLITQSLSRKFFLVPRTEQLKEVTVISDQLEHSTQIGNKPGRMKLNASIIRFLPGYGDNTVFNILRLMPGIMASGEQASDLLIWGSYESHSMIRFDGFTVFGLKNFNDNISAINPFMVKNIEVLKGGYEARYGDRVGGIVDITGKNGNLAKPSFTFNINNNTLNSMLEFPVKRRSSFLAAFRQTYYNLYDPAELNLFGERSTMIEGKGKGKESQVVSRQGINFTVLPDYVFRDGNLKYSWHDETGTSFSASFYSGGDQFSYNMNGDYKLTKINLFEKEKNRQYGGSVSLELPGKSGNSASVGINFSSLETRREEKSEQVNQKTNAVRVIKEVDSENRIMEYEFKAVHQITFREGHSLEGGIGLISDDVRFLRNYFSEPQIDLRSNSPRLTGYLQDNLPLGENIELKSGLRMIYATQLKRFYPEPRIAFTVKPTENISLNASWGLYSQYVSKSSVVDSSLNYSWFWTNSDNLDIPVLKGTHFVAGASFNKNDFIISIEGYYKTTTGLSRYVNATNFLKRGFYQGDARIKGLDIYVKKEFGDHMAWISYSLNKSEEHFPFYIRNYYRPAPQDQRHEVKGAAIFNFGRFYLSSNYVFGSGFERYSISTDEKLEQPVYSRLDAALVYRFRPAKISCETGISVLNLFNRENIKYSNLRRLPADDLKIVGIYAEAIPFTPTLFLNIKL